MTAPHRYCQMSRCDGMGRVYAPRQITVDRGGLSLVMTNIDGTMRMFRNRGRVSGSLPPLVPAKATWSSSPQPAAPGDQIDPERLGQGHNTLIQLTRTAGFAGMVAVTSPDAADTGELPASGADIVPEPFQNTVDRAIDLLADSTCRESTVTPEIETEERQAS